MTQGSHACRVEAVRAAIAAHQDMEIIKSLCEGGKIPAECRAELWKVLRRHGQF